MAMKNEESFDCAFAELRKDRSGCLNVRLRQIGRAISFQRLLTNQRVLSASAAHEGVCPVRMKIGIDFAVVADNTTKVH